MKVRLAYLESELDGCALHRLHWPMQAIRKHDPSIDVRPVRIPQDFVGCDFDVLVLPRTVTPSLVDTIKGVQARGVAVVVELDDDTKSAHPGNPAHWVTTQWRDITGQDARTAGKTAMIADMVTVTTPELARIYAPHGRVRVIRNRVPESYLSGTESCIKDGRTVGYVGALAFHPGDLDVIGHGARSAVEACNARFVGVGDETEDEQQRAAELGLPRQPRIKDAVGIPDGEVVTSVPFDDYAETVARLDIGLAPLADTRFNRCKSALRVLTYAACQVLPIASPLPEVEYLVGRGLKIGLAKSPRDWDKQIRFWLDHPDARLEAVEHNRALVASEWTYDDVAAREWVSAWRQAVLNRELVAA